MSITPPSALTNGTHALQRRRLRHRSRAMPARRRGSRGTADRSAEYPESHFLKSIHISFSDLRAEAPPAHRPSRQAAAPPGRSASTSRSPIRKDWRSDGEAPPVPPITVGRPSSSERIVSERPLQCLADGRRRRRQSVLCYSKVTIPRLRPLRSPRRPRPHRPAATPIPTPIRPLRRSRSNPAWSCPP